MRGVSIAVINNYQIEWAKGYGFADFESKRPVEITTLFQAGSISKPVAAVAAMKLVEERKTRTRSRHQHIPEDLEVAG